MVVFPDDEHIRALADFMRWRRDARRAGGETACASRGDALETNGALR